MSLKVLIADPDWRFVAQASQYLESHAHLVVHEPRVKEAIAQAEHWKPDLVILSADLANKGLIEPITAIRPRPAVLLTGRMDRYDLAWKAWQKGGDDLLMKPMFRIQELHEAVVTALENATTGKRHVPGAATA